MEALDILMATRAPTTEFINDETIASAMEACPALKACVEGGIRGGDFDKALSSTLNRIFDSFEDNGFTPILQKLTVEVLQSVDEKLGAESDYISSIVDTFSELKKVVSLKGLSENFKKGVILGYAAVLAIVGTQKEEKEPAYLKFGKRMEEARDMKAGLKADKSAPIVERQPKPTESPSKNIDLIQCLNALIQSGVPRENIVMRPVADEAGNIVKIEVALEFPSSVEFMTLAKANAVAKTATGRDLEFMAVEDNGIIKIVSSITVAA